MSLLNSFFEKGVGRSNFDFTHTVSFTAAPGPIIPVMHFDTLPKDSVLIKPTIQIDSLPLKSPCLGQFEVSLDYFYMPWRAVMPELRMDVENLDPLHTLLPEYHGAVGIGTAYSTNGVDESEFMVALKGGEMNEVLMTFVHQSSLENYLYHDYGYNGCYDISDSSIGEVATKAVKATTYNGIPYMLYYMAFYYYYANWQSDTYIMYNSAYRFGATASHSSTALPWDSIMELRDSPNLTMQPLSYLSSTITHWTNGVWTIDNDSSMIVGSTSFSNYFNWYSNPQTSLSIQSLVASFVNTAWFNSAIYQDSNDNTFHLGAACSPTPMFTRWDGLVNCALMPDMRTSYIRNATRDSIRTRTAVSVQDGKVFVDDIISATRIKKYLELGGFGASGYRDWVHAQFGVTPPDLGCKPSYLGRSKFVMDFNAVIATSSDGLGDLGGRGSDGGSFKARRYNFTDYGTFMALFTIKPIVAYRNGINLNDKKTVLAQCQAPVLDRVGWQPLMGNQLNQSSGSFRSPVLDYNYDFPRMIYHAPSDKPTPTNINRQYIDPSQLVVGYQPAFSEYMAEVNKVYGDLATTLDYWMITRNFYREYDQYKKNEFPAPSYHQYGTFDNNVYVRPEDYQLAWSYSANGAENFICQIKFDIKYKRPIGKNPIPSVC